MKPAATRARGSWQKIRLEPTPPALLRSALGAEASNRMAEELATAARSLAGRTIWMISSSAAGGGVAELLRAVLPYWLGAGLDVRWIVLRAPRSFFVLTKRLHNRLHGDPGDGGELGSEERHAYEQVLAASGSELGAWIGQRDMVVLHDPQTAGLLPSVTATGAKVIWRSHVGADHPNELTQSAWAFLAPYVTAAETVVFTRDGFVPPEVAELPQRVIRPCIDPRALKNRELRPADIRTILTRAGIPSALRARGLVLHVGRWDRLKDPAGVIDCFAQHVLGETDAHLIVAGPGIRAVVDDPEAAGVYRDVETHRRELPSRTGRRIHLLRLPLHNLQENATIVNALQRTADVVIKKSLQEGFGLGVTEAMWKRRAVVATAVGGHREQIEDGVSGVLIADPRDLVATGQAVVSLLGDRARRHEIGEAARLRVRDQFLPDHYTEQWMSLLTELTGRRLAVFSSEL